MMFLRKENNPKTDLYLSKLNDLLVSNINFEKGAFCVNKIGDICTSTDYQPYEINIQINYDYFNLVLRAEKFLAYVKKLKPDGMKTRARYNFIKIFSIPVPDSIKEQQKLADEYNETIDKADAAQKKAEELENEIDRYLLDTLGVKKHKDPIINSKILNYYSLKDLSRWDVWTQNSEFVLSQYKFKKFSSIIIDKPLYGANEKAIKKQSETRYIRITDINEDGSLNDEFVTSTKIEDKYLLENDDFLIARSGNTVGKTFLYKNNLGKCIFAGYLVRYKLNNRLVIPEYVLYYTKSSLFKSWIKSNQRIAGQPNINGQEYLNADIIVPNIDVQKQIVATISEMKAKIKDLRQDAETLRQKAKKDFEGAVFGGESSN